MYKTFWTQLTFENFPFVLDSEIANRNRLTRYFLETEMWYLLYNIIRAAQKFEKNKRKIGDINPLNILINDDGQIKILSCISLPNEITNTQRSIEDPQARVYLGKLYLMQRPKNIKSKPVTESTIMTLIIAGLKSSA